MRQEATRKKGGTSETERDRAMGERGRNFVISLGHFQWQLAVPHA